jgi:hypothetical protein
MSDHPPLRIDPTSPSSPDGSPVPCENTVKQGIKQRSGYEGHKGHVGRGGALLAGLFGDVDALTPEPVPESMRSPVPPPPVTVAEPMNAEPPPVAGPACQYCESVRLADCENPPGIRCDDCGRLAWIDDGESLHRVGWHDHDLGSMAPEELPTCDGCGRLCDTQTLDDVWHCSRCLPDDAAARRKRTKTFLSHAADVRRYTDARNG